MPYPGEKASRIGHVGTVRNEAVKVALKRWAITTASPDSAADITDLCIPIDELDSIGDPGDIDFSITVDGSDTEVETTREHPTVKVGYLRVAGSMVRLDEFRKLSNARYIDPRDVKRSHTEYAFDVALPGAQLARPGMSGVDTWRAELDAFLRDSRFDSSTTMTPG